MISINIGGKPFSVVRLNEFSSEEEISGIKDLISGFSCPLNGEVETFLKNDALGFDERNQAVTYLIFAGSRFVAYFTLANKLIQVQKNKISKTVLRRLLRTAEDNGGDFLNVPSILVAQLGKNYSNGNNTFISGQELLLIIDYFVKEVQKYIGGAVYFLECDSDKKKIIEFYTRNGFVLFSERKANSTGIDLLQFMKKI